MIFRRIHGHIVPIKEQRKEIAKGTGEVGAGIAVAAAGGAGSAKVVKTAADMAAKSKGQFRVAYSAHILNRDQLHLPGVALNAERIQKTMRKAAFGRHTARKLFSTRNRILAASITVGSLLAAKGANRISNAVSDPKKEHKQFSASSLGIGSLIAGTTYAAYYKGLGITGMSAVKNIVARFKGVRRPVQTDFKTKYGRTKI